MATAKKKAVKNVVAESQMAQFVRELDSVEGLERLGREAAEWAKQKNAKHTKPVQSK